ncbi:hypothetical protein NLG97_g4886 [Lecanicillium saksenae]|uniref:Uncharacterized protein n=1 Tax=Lecanicillium saksenae TaxID=468837 RepID=A0ACC1QWJ9_9HYPO|nr:hypothetical protein NLG97_g4886 [Lecanicillium saksenae]
MPPPPNAPTSPKAMRRAHSFTARPSTNATPPAHSNDAVPLTRRASAPDGDVSMGNASESAAETTALSLAAVPETPTETPIPQLRSVAPAIFVPVAKLFPDDTVFERFASLEETDRAEYMRQALTRNDKHTAAVRGNLLALFRRENARIMQAMRAAELSESAVSSSPSSPHERQLARQKGWMATDADMERMIASMAAPAPAPPPKLTQHEQVAQILSGKPRKDAAAAADVIGDVPEPSFMHRAGAQGWPNKVSVRPCSYAPCVTRCTTPAHSH